MQAKERLLNALLGKEIDHAPWSPFLAYWWDYQPKNIQDFGEVELLQELGADPLIRGHIPAKGSNVYQDLEAFDVHRKHCEIIESISGDKKTVTYRTKYGDLCAQYRFVNQTWFLCEHPVKTEEHFKILQYIIENTELTPNHAYYDDVVKRYGDDMLAIPVVTPFGKTGFQSLVEYWVGTIDLTYALMDYEEVVEETLNAMWQLSRHGAEISAESKAEVFLSWEDSSTTNYSPMQYKKYILPEINEWCDILHSNGKYYVQHACGHIKDLLPIMAESKIDGLESISPPPTGNIGLFDIRAGFPDEKALIGGIEPVFFQNSSMEELETQVHEILEKMQGKRYVLANSDSCPPDVDIKKFSLVSQIVKG